MSQEQWATVVSYAQALWAVVGPLIGVLLGAYISSLNQRKHWRADRKTQEYRELMTVLTQAFGAMLHQAEPIRVYSVEEDQKFLDIQEKALITISDRVFIANELEELKVMDRWLALRKEFRDLHRRKEAGTSLAAIKYDLIGRGEEADGMMRPSVMYPGINSVEKATEDHDAHKEHLCVVHNRHDKGECYMYIVSKAAKNADPAIQTTHHDTPHYSPVA